MVYTLKIDECGKCGSEDIDNSQVRASDPYMEAVGYRKCNNCGAIKELDDGGRGWYKDENR